jgi:nicotinamide mononucleotide adenylyltransferase
MAVYDIKKSVALFSGRFDGFHAGHWLTIARLGTRHEVHVMVLDFPEQEYPTAYRVQIIKEAMRYTKGGPYHVDFNKVHFAKVTREELARYPRFDFYASGNLDCIKHMESLGYCCYYTERAYEYAATADRVAKAVMGVLGK